LLPLAWFLLHYAHPPLEAYNGRFLNLCKQDDPGYNKSCRKLLSANEHTKAERIFSNFKNIAFRPGVQAGS
jgi:hypothetical protein